MDVGSWLVICFIFGCLKGVYRERTLEWTLHGVFAICKLAKEDKRGTAPWAFEAGEA